MPIHDIALRTSRERWTIEASSKRGSARSILVAWHDDDDDIYIYIYIYIYNINDFFDLSDYLSLSAIAFVRLVFLTAATVHSVLVNESIGEGHWWVRPYFSSSYQRVLLILLGWFTKWRVIGHSAAVLLGTASSICSIERAASLCSYHLRFSLSVLLESKLCNHTDRSDFHTTVNLPIVI